MLRAPVSRCCWGVSPLLRSLGVARMHSRRILLALRSCLRRRRTALVLFNRDSACTRPPCAGRGNASRRCGDPTLRARRSDHWRRRRVGEPGEIPRRLPARPAVAPTRRGANLVVTRGDPVHETMRIARTWCGHDLRLGRRLRLARPTRASPRGTPVNGSEFAFIRRAGRDGRALGRSGAERGGPLSRVHPVLERLARRGLAPDPSSAAPHLDAFGGEGRQGSATSRPESGRRSPDLCQGGETAARDLLRRWASRSLARYADAHDDLAADATRASVHSCTSAVCHRSRSPPAFVIVPAANHTYDNSAGATSITR